MRQVPALAVLLVAIAGRLSSQTIVQAPAGLLTGVVLDSITGNPVGYALVIAEGVGRVFASEAGRFSLGGLPEGRLSLRVQQIGYRSVTSQLLVKTREGAGATLTIRLTRQPLVLPSLSARAPDCRSEGAESEGTLIEEVFKNAERLLVLQKDYPYQASMREINSVFDARETLLEQKVDTTSFDSRYLSSYHRGRVLVRTGRLAAREYATYFSPADLAAPEFRRSHCFWFDGTDDADGVPAYRIAFRPLVRVKSGPLGWVARGGLRDPPPPAVRSPPGEPAVEGNRVSRGGLPRDVHAGGADPGSRISGPVSDGTERHSSHRAGTAVDPAPASISGEAP